jgi:hypothetical protein
VYCQVGISQQSYDLDRDIWGADKARKSDLSHGGSEKSSSSTSLTILIVPLLTPMIEIIGIT